MTTSEMLRMVRRIEVRTRRALSGPLAGFHRSSFRGPGIEFEEVRAYQPGDDVRAIDWKVTARMAAPFSKIFGAERQRVVWLLVDETASMELTGAGRSKRQTAIEAAALIALSAATAQDRVGLVAWGRRSRIVPPQRGERHSLRIVRDLLDDATPPSRPEPDRRIDRDRLAVPSLAVAAETLRRTARRRSVVFVISDFLGADGVAALRPLHRYHQSFALHVIDPVERRLPDAGLVRWRDAETARSCVVDTSAPRYRRAFENATKRRERDLRLGLARWNIDYVALPTMRPTALSLLRHFRRC